MEGGGPGKVQLGYRVATESKEMLCQHLDAVLLGDAGTLGSARGG